MRIGGLEKQSFIDWEGKIAAVIFTKGCNFRCPYCHNPDLVYPELIRVKEDIPEQEILQYLLTRKNWLDGVVITGGEPTIQSDLDVFIRKIKQINYKIKLDTNGSSPEVLKKLIHNKLIDCVAMDIKTILDLKKYQEICASYDPLLLEKICTSIEILKKADIEVQFRTTVVPSFHTEEMLTGLIEHFSLYNYKLQECRDNSPYIV
ncbi:MAG: anaerobic ribonucleoside-triphosphate reductase activating protein [Bacteroidales bacterium]|jgi:pyruvate formate lyase activating enzyme|nr:anaerobic ribonucleoside-triphosphate reductase activating protein [Bacteroidales bacterium]MDD2264823.1 anaerobic ribonucleoside-triphosphate reductase activating protein [Bacteroidales bacterium]MDD2832079.1 anaerobic ribonucleoside-triphosphate reductase activating protein [Bacteroidales bacterium]MDD3208727.1 anaerobic ribonucleoside-triphosphate reductase activating protein [Bacteroidales bacterium]MDD3697290.1 anaerobic ribonucleoside-triphosphate reductase activating protein [Bacteroi